MTSMPASRKERAITLAPRSCPSRPGFATSTRIFRSTIDLYLTTEGAEVHSYRGLPAFDCRLSIADCRFSDLRFQISVLRLGAVAGHLYMVLISRLRHRYQQATDRYGSHDFAIFAIISGFGILRFL